MYTHILRVTSPFPQKKKISDRFAREVPVASLEQVLSWCKGMEFSKENPEFQ